jgi:hypothetical protein
MSRQKIKQDDTIYQNMHIKEEHLHFADTNVDQIDVGDFGGMFNAEVYFFGRLVVVRDTLGVLPLRSCVLTKDYRLLTEQEKAEITETTGVRGEYITQFEVFTAGFHSPLPSAKWELSLDKQ